MGFFDNLRNDTYRPIGGAEVAHKDDPRAYTGLALLAQSTFYCSQADQQKIEQIYLQGGGDRGGLAALEATGQAMLAEHQRRHRQAYDDCHNMEVQEEVVSTANEKLADAIVGHKWNLPRLQHEAVKERQKLVKLNEPRMKNHGAQMRAEEVRVEWLQQQCKDYASARPDRSSKPWDQIFAENRYELQRQWKRYRSNEAGRLQTTGSAAREERTQAGLILPDLDKRILTSGDLTRSERGKLADEVLETSEHLRHGLVYMPLEPAAPKLKRLDLSLAS